MCALILILPGHAGIFKTTLVPNVLLNYAALCDLLPKFSDIVKFVKCIRNFCTKK